jgi:hypothetical protein
MKKFLLFAAVSLFFVKTASAQHDLLSFDEHNKYIYYQVADMPGISADTLYQRAWQFLRSAYHKSNLKQVAPGAISGEGKFVTYEGASVLKHENGEISYQLNIEFKDQKFRFWLTDFVFTPYQRDRYGNFVPQVGVDIPLESITDKLEKKDAADDLDAAGAFCKRWGEKLKLSLTHPDQPKKEVITKKVVTDNW